MSNKFIIEKNIISDDSSCYLIAEIGSNHNRSKKTVKKLIDASADAGFNAVKFQIYDPEEAFSKNESTKDVRLNHLYGLKPWWQIARDKILMPREWFEEMFLYVRKKKMTPLSAIHNEKDCQFLKKFGLPAIKIASIDLNFRQLHQSLLKFNLPFIISSGMASNKEINDTVNFFKKNKAKICLLHCNSCYPPEPEEMNLNNIIQFKKDYKFPIGLSDHASNNYASFAAVTMGAKIIEKHITLDKKYPGPDHPFAIEPSEMKEFVKGIRFIEKSLGNYKRKLSTNEEKNKKMIRRSLVAKRNLEKGSYINEKDIKYARPGTGIPTTEADIYFRKKLKKKINAETVLMAKHFE
tara:strand:+ start:16 stop:1068 length:1053 start_codon:yes stop_codon:yes gene_type:complete